MTPPTTTPSTTTPPTTPGIDKLKPLSPAPNAKLEKAHLAEEEWERIQPLPEHNIVWPPNDLYSDEPPLESTLHLQQMMLLLACLRRLWKDRQDYFAAGNLTIYYSQRQRKNEKFRGPDFFVVLNTQPHPRKSWMLWEEDGQYPNIIVELLSDSTAKVDRTVKKRLYAETFRTPEYFWYDPASQEFQGFELLRGDYQPIAPTSDGWLWSEQLQLFLGVYNKQLRYFTADKEIVPTPEEAEAAEQQRADAAQQRADAAQERAYAAQERADAAQERANKLAEKLKALGVDVNDLS
ncbi:MAG: Uma2 family endonuclease [Cyanobacteria bacterium J06643_4]